jgi:hypothetical protein
MGHPQALTLVLLRYFFGWHGNPQAWAFFHTSSHLIILLSPHLKTFLHTKLYTILISNIRLCKIVNPLLVRFQLKYNTS